jgi:uncharacterized protein
VCFGQSILGSYGAVVTGFPSQPFTNSSLMHLVFSEIVFGAVAITLLWFRGFHVAALLPLPDLSGTLKGLAIILLAWSVAWLFSLPFSNSNPSQPIEDMVSNSNLSLSVIILMALVNGTFEEIFLLGFLQRGLARYGLSFSLGLTLLIRVTYHLYQGPVAAVMIFGMGLVFALSFLYYGKLWPVVFAHILADI